MTAIDWFLAWIERDELAVPLVVEEVRQDRVMFTFDGWPCLNGSVQPTGISIWAYRGEEPWDGIFDIDIQPIERDGRWVCGLCWEAFEKNLYPEPPSYPSAEVLWTSHSLAPLGDWCSEKLARAGGVGFWDYDGMLVAKLVFSDDDAQGAVEVARRSGPLTE